MSSHRDAGAYVGYDPGGDGRHGLAVLQVTNHGPVAVDTYLLPTAETVISHIRNLHVPLLGIGIDTLTCWSTGSCGWRPADRWLRLQYPAVRNSVASANSLYGAMTVNGMAVLIAIRAVIPDLPITETHPKLLNWHLRHERYDYFNNARQMNEVLCEQIGLLVAPESEHEWDAGISALAAYRTAVGQWTHDLHTLSANEGEQLIFPCGSTQFSWPE